MPKRDAASIGAPCWVELFTSDVLGSRAFYGELFGWTSEEPNDELGGYFNFSKDGERIAGGMGNDPSSGAPDMWTVYLASDDAKATVDAAAARGGGIEVPAMDVMDLGTMAVVTDSGGARIGVWKPGTHKGFGIIAEPGAPAWFELHTRDYDASVAFYRDVFGWKTETMSDTLEFRYTTLGSGDDALAGIMDASASLPAGEPASWSIYFAVENADVSLAQIEQLGGSIVVPAEDTPYGRLAEAADPTGTLFKIVQ